jgi:hypothetical protein
MTWAAILKVDELSVYAQWTWSIFSVTSAMIGLGYGYSPPATLAEVGVMCLVTGRRCAPMLPPIFPQGMQRVAHSCTEEVRLIMEARVSVADWAGASALEVGMWTEKACKAWPIACFSGAARAHGNHRTHSASCAGRILDCRHALCCHVSAWPTGSIAHACRCGCPSQRVDGMATALLPEPCRPVASWGQTCQPRMPGDVGSASPWA